MAPSCPLLDLPQEIRDEIWEYALPLRKVNLSPPAVHGKSSSNQESPKTSRSSLLLTCKTIQSDTYPILYANTTVIASPSDLLNFVDKHPLAAALVRGIEIAITAGPERNTLSNKARRGIELDLALAAPKLTKVRSLELVVVLNFYWAYAFERREWDGDKGTVGFKQMLLPLRQIPNVKEVKVSLREPSHFHASYMFPNVVIFNEEKAQKEAEIKKLLAPKVQDEVEGSDSARKLLPPRRARRSQVG